MISAVAAINLHNKKEIADQHKPTQLNEAHKTKKIDTPKVNDR